MDWVAWLLLESLAALAAVLFTVNFVLLVYWRRGGRARVLLIGLAASVVLLLVQALVVTQREHAVRLLSGIERDVVTAQTAALAAALSPDFEADGMGPEEFVALVDRLYGRVRVRSLRRGQLQFQESGAERFVIEVAYQADIVVEEYAGWFPTRWEIAFERIEAGWRIADVEPAYIGGMVDPSWDRVSRH